MKKTLILPLALLTLTTACSKHKGGGSSSSSEEIQIIDVNPDSTVYGVSDIIRHDSLRWVQNFSTSSTSSDTTWITLYGTQKFGSMAPGHRLAVIFDESKKNAQLIIDLSELMGRWVEPDAVDEGSVHGIELQEGGAANSINSRANQYVSWSICNGKLLLVNSISGITDDDLPRDTFTITHLSKDSLRVSTSMARFFFRRSNSAEEDKVQEYEMYTSPDAGAFDPEGDAPEGSDTQEIPEYDRVF